MYKFHIRIHRIILQQKMADEKRKSIPPSLDQEIGKFDSSKLNKTEVHEKNPLPSVEGMHVT
jgi:hypothetical protein